MNRSKRSVTRPLSGRLSHLKVAWFSATPTGPDACLPVPASGCTRGSQPRHDQPSTRSSRVPKMLPHVVPLPAGELPRDMNRALPLDLSDHLRDRVLRRNRDHHVHVVSHQVAFFDLAFLLSRQPVKYLAQVLLDLTEDPFPAVLRDEHHVVLTFPTGPADWSNSSSPCGVERAGSTGGSPICRKMRSITCGSSTNVMTRTGKFTPRHEASRAGRYRLAIDVSCLGRFI